MYTETDSAVNTVSVGGRLIDENDDEGARCCSACAPYLNLLNVCLGLRSIRISAAVTDEWHEHCLS